MNEGRTARGARIGGRWALSLRAVLVLAAVTLVASLLRGSRYGIDGARAALIAWATGIATVAIISLVADRTVFRHRRQHPVPAWWVVAYGLIAGLAAALIVTPLNDVLTDTPTVALGVALMTSGGLSTLVLTACAAIFTEIDDNRRRRRALLLQAVELRGLNAARADLGDAISRALQQEIDDATRGIREQLERAGSAVDVASRADFAAGLANAVDRDLRPLSRRLGDASQTAVPSPGFWELARQLAGALQVQPVATGVAVGIGTLAFIAPETAAIPTLARSAFLGFLAWLGLEAARRIVRARPALRNAEVVIGASFATGLGVMNFIISKAFFDATRPWVQVVAIMIAVPIATVILAVTARTLAEGTPRTRAMEFAVDERQLETLAANREFVRVSRELAQYVHGTLQSHLLATAFAIEDASRTGDPAAVDAAIAAARQAFDMRTPPAQPAQSIEVALQQQVALWDGFVDISLDLHPDLRGMSPSDARRVAQVAEEAISNARKHGHARTIDISVTPAAGAAVLVIRDDGSGPTGGAPGMGSALIDDHTGGAWTLQRTPGRTTLTATVILTGDTAVPGG